MITIGITGIIGSGKSKISKLFEVLGIPVYYSDNEAKSIISTNSTIKQKLIYRYGKDTYLNNTLNKSKLAEIIFNDKNERDYVNSIVHPVVVEDFKSKVKSSNNQIYAIESALIAESSLTEILDYVIHVYCPDDLRIPRIRKRDKLSEKQVKQRISSQKDIVYFDSISDYKILNDENNSLILQTLDILNKIKGYNFYEI